MWQVYQTLYYQTKLKPIVNAAYEDFLKDYKPSPEEGETGEGKTLKNARLQIQNRIAREMYEKESSEVKDKVQEYREELKQANGAVNDEPAKLQK